MPPRRFKAQESTIYRDLQATMRKLGATSLRVKGRDLLNPQDIEAEVAWDRTGRRYVARCRKWSDPLDNLRAVERVIYYLHRALEEYGVSQTSAGNPGADETFQQVFAGFEALPEDSVLLLGSGQAPWWDVLGVQQDASRADVLGAYRSLVRIHHPDVGGDPEMFKRVRAAYEQGLEARR